MEATILDLRYKMKDVLRALDRGESVKISYHGKLKGVITPSRQAVKMKVKEHAFYGIAAMCQIKATT